MAHAIRNGRINKELLSPISYFKYYFGIYLGEIGFAIPVSLAVLIICSIFWHIVLPTSWINMVLFLLVIVLILPISFFIQMIVANTKKISNINFCRTNSTSNTISRMVSKNFKCIAIQRIYIYSNKYLLEQNTIKWSRMDNSKVIDLDSNTIFCSKNIF